MAEVGKKSRRLSALRLALTDVLALVLCAYAAMLAKFAPELQAEDFLAVTYAMPALVLMYIAAFAVFRMYRTLWRYADAFQFAKQGMAGIVAFGVTFIANNLIWKLAGYLPLSNNYLFIFCVFSLVGISACRLAIKLFHAGRGSGFGSSRRLLIVGAGDAGSHIAQMFARDKTAGVVCAIVDDDPSKQGYLICDIPVSGTVGDIPNLVKQKGISDIIIALPTASRPRLDEISAICLSTGCFVRVFDKLKRVEEDKNSL